jgi:hypothetical protein
VKARRGTGLSRRRRILGSMDQASERADETDDLLSTLEVIEAQPLATRAEAYEALHDTLARRLEATPGSPS